MGKGLKILKTSDNRLMNEINEPVLAVIALEKLETDRVPLLLISIVLLLFAGFSTSVPTLLNFLLVTYPL